MFTIYQIIKFAYMEPVNGFQKIFSAYLFLFMLTLLRRTQMFFESIEEICN